MAEPRTIEPGAMLIATSSPFPPFAVEREDTDSGFDAELMRAVCGRLGLRWNLAKHEGDDCNAIFDGLRTGDHDAVVAATTITPDLRDGRALLRALPDGRPGAARERRHEPAPHVDRGPRDRGARDRDGAHLRTDRGRPPLGRFGARRPPVPVRRHHRRRGGPRRRTRRGAGHAGDPWRGGWQPTTTISRWSRRSRRASSSASRSRRGTRRCATRSTRGWTSVARKGSSSGSNGAGWTKAGSGRS